MLNGGTIKGVQVTLYLSSRAEMQKTIEKARTPAAPVYTSKPVVPQPTLMMPQIQQVPKKIPEAPVMAQHPPVTNYLTQLMQQQQPPAVITTPQINQMMPAYQTMMPIVKNPMQNVMGLGLTNAAAATAAYTNYFSMMDPSAVGFMNQAAAVAAKPAQMQYNKDPRSRRSNSRERRQRSRSPDRRRRSRSPPDSDRERDGGSRRRTRFSERTDTAPSTAKAPSNSYSIPPPASNNIWDAPPPQIFNTANNNAALPTRNYQTENNSNGSSSFGNIGTCVKVSNVDNDTFYSDLRKFFVNLPIGNNDIKFVNDAKGNRTGVVLIRFLSSDSKKKALTKNMWQLKSTQVMITSVSEEDFESGLVKNSGNGNSSRRNDDRNDRGRDRDRYDRYDRSRSNSRDRESRDSSRNFNRIVVDSTTAIVIVIVTEVSGRTSSRRTATTSRKSTSPMKSSRF
jgi:RNA-binding protein 12